VQNRLNASFSKGFAMKLIFASTCAGLIAFPLLAAPSWADSNDIRASDRAIEFDVGASSLKYGESPDSATPYAHDTETGWMPSLNAGVGWLTPQGTSPLFSDIYLRLDGQISFGSTHYNGGLQNIFGNVTPYQSTTNDTILRLSGKVGRAFALNDQVMLTPFADFAYRSWRRELTGTGGYTELYETNEALGGLLVQVSPISRLVLSLTGEVGSTLSPYMTTQGFTYNQGSETVWEIGGKIGYALTPSVELTGTVQFSGFGFGQSPVVGGAYEPDSYTHQLSLLTGLAYHLP
jgi:hypothetical protein